MVVQDHSTGYGQKGDTKTATKWPGQNGDNQNGKSSKRRQKFIANDKTVIECLVTESALNKKISQCLELRNLNASLR